MNTTEVIAIKKITTPTGISHFMWRRHHDGARSSAGGTILEGSVVDWSRIWVSLSDDTWATLKNGWQRKWAEWRETRAERDVLASYRADYGEGARFRWWQRLRAAVGLLFVVVLLGAGLTMLVGLFFIGFTIALETLV
ncbi:hypothetical protein [Candidatus Poriferisocius sp.]|uniref:hypothetical protein n=1 Tax=Candidatus Poriferisocius sp. TaxID=3101276 RepID=UPI003B02DDA8